MHVVHLGKYYPPASGGIENHTQTLARAQAEAGARVTVVAVNHRADDGRDATFRALVRTPSRSEADGAVRVHRVGRLGNVARLDLVPRLVGVLRRISATRPDVWHVHAPNPTMLLALAACPALEPLVVTHHADVVRQRVLRHALRPFERAAYARADAIVASSPAYADASPALAHDRAKVAVIPFGIDLEPYRVAERAPDDAGEAGSAADAGERRSVGRDRVPRWLSVGRLIYYKALDVSLRALREVPGTLTVVGTGPMEEGWRRLARSLGVEDRVVWTGALSAAALRALYRDATALWFPSDARSEAFGIVQVEAMAAGCPVINADISGSGVPWVSRHEETGLTVPVDDPAALAAAARRLVDDPALRARLARGAVETARERFDHRVMASRTLALYETVLRRRPAWAS